MVRKFGMCVFIGVILLSLMTACGQTSGSNTNDSGNSASNSGNQTSESTRTVTDATGEVAVPAEPKRIALVHWGLSDHLLTFDLNSVAITLPFTSERSTLLNSEVYKPYVDKLDELVVIGESTKPNLEALLQYNPDLIIAGNVTNKEISERLEQIATTVFIDEKNINVFNDWRSVVTFIGKVLGQEERAQTVISDLEQKVQDASEQLSRLEDETVAFLQVRQKNVWLMGTSRLSLYYDGLGLTPLDSDLRENGGLLTLEGLSELDPDHLFLGYFNYYDQSVSVLTDEWSQSEVWSDLKAAKNDQVYAINGAIALSFGPIAQTYGVNAIVDALEQ